MSQVPAALAVHRLAEVEGQALSRLADEVVTIEALRAYGLSPAALLAAWRGAAAAPADSARLRLAVTAAGPVGVAWSLARGAFASGAYLRFLAVVPAAAGAGVGRRLMDDFEGAWRPAGGWFLLSGAENTAAAAFYAGRGYRPVGSLMGFARPGIEERLWWRRPPAG